jgi:tripartite-type tricarboxylate transporter receptor subunit TctC
VMPYLKAGKLRALGVSSAERIALLPDVPTFGAFGIEADIPGWSGFWGPAKLPPPLIDSLFQTLSKGAREKSFEIFARDNGSEVVCLPPDEFKAYVASEIARYQRLLPPLGIQVD